MKKSFKLINKYCSIFNEEPARVAFVSINSKEYVDMLNYCIDNLTPINNEIISMFIKKDRDLIKDEGSVKIFSTNSLEGDIANKAYEILQKLKEEMPYSDSMKTNEEEIDEAFLIAIREIVEKPELVEFKDGKFVCSDDASVETKAFVYHRNKKYKYWQDIKLETPKIDPDIMSDSEWEEHYRCVVIQNFGEELLAKEENKDLIILKDDYYSCKLEAPYELYFYAECKNKSTYFMKVVSPRIKIERIKESRMKAGYTFYEDYSSEELAGFPAVDPESINKLIAEHKFNPLVWNGESWINCYDIFKSKKM